MAVQEIERSQTYGLGMQKMIAAWPLAWEDKVGWFHHDDNPRFDFMESESGWITIHSWTGRTEDEILSMVGLTRRDIAPHNGYINTRVYPRIDVTQLGQVKRIYPSFLVAQGLTDNYIFNGYGCVGIPYFRADGSQYTKWRVRKSIEKPKTGDKQYWDKATPGKIIPYGLHKLDIARRLGYLFIGEGESDAWACWLHDEPYLGIPGAEFQKCLTGIDLNDIPAIYILSEPDQVARLQAKGKSFYRDTYSKLRQEGYKGSIFFIDFKEATDYKDPSELHIALFDAGQAARFPEILRDARETATPGDDEDDLPQIIVGGRQYREQGEQALQAMYEGEKATPSIFVKAGELVRVARNERGEPILQNVGIAEIRNALTRTANYFRIKKGTKDDTDKLIPTSPPKELAEYILAMNPADWPFPPLTGIVEMPIMRPDGSILDTPGYDCETHLYYIANETMKLCKVPHTPTGEQLLKAVELINMCIGEFPYETQADYANMFALLITLVTRYMYDGDVMTALINATKQGTGKSLLAQFACIIASGRPPAMTNFPAKEEETKKVIDAKVLAGVHTIIFDNIKRKFQSAALDILSTCRGYYSVRPLGQSKDITVFTQTTVIATGNNVQIDTDQARRCYQIRLVSPVSNPDERTDITIKELDLYGIEHRAELVAALLTIVRSWHVNGKPQVKNKLQSSSFGRWAGTVGSILAHVGIEGFQDNRDTLKAEANSDESQITSFLQTWHDRYKNTYVPAMTILDHILSDVEIENKVKEGEVSNFLNTLPDDLRAKLFDRERKKQSMIQILAKWLVERIKTPYGPENLHIEYATDTVKGQKIWRINTGGTGGTGGQNNRYAREKIGGKNTDTQHKNSHSEQPNLPPVPPVPPVVSGGENEDAKAFYETFISLPDHHLKIKEDGKIGIGVPGDMSDEDFADIEAKVEAMKDALVEILQQQAK
jgi:hypothetical protein